MREDTKEVFRSVPGALGAFIPLALLLAVMALVLLVIQ